MAYVQINHVTRGRNVAKMMQRIKFMFLSMEKGTEELGLKTAQKMRGFIASNKKRQGSNNNLERHILTYKRVSPEIVSGFGPSRIEVGIGSIELLDRVAPYWFFLNYGISQKGMTIPYWGKRVPGFFGAGSPPDAGKRGKGVGREGFTVEKGTYWMKPKSPILPISYIQKTMSWLHTIQKVHYSGILRKITIK